MDRFLRFTVTLLVLCVLIAAAVVSKRSYDSAKESQQRLVLERKSLGNYLLGTQTDLRRLEMIVEEQKISGDNMVLSTTFLVYPCALSAEGEIVLLTPQRRFITGDHVRVDGCKFDIPGGILDDGFPLNSESDKQTKIPEPLTLTVFGHIYSPAAMPTDVDWYQPWGHVHPGYRPDPWKRTEFEEQIWARVGQLMNNKAYRERSKVVLTEFPAVDVVLKPGVISQVFVGPNLQLSTGQVENKEKIQAMLEQAHKINDENEKPADATRPK